VSPTRLDEASLEAWGRALGASAQAPLMLALQGPLGAGKSTLARAIARGAGVQGAVPSPTFNLVLRYPTPLGHDLVHLDLYRIQRTEELADLGWHELPAPDEVVVVEWPERADSWMPPDFWLVRLDLDPRDPNVRLLQATAQGQPGPIPPVPPSESP